MALRSEYALGHSEFNEFLFAFVGEESSGQQLTVLSALSRLGLDPWREAARLSEMPMQAATDALAATIGALPGGRWKASDLESIALRLVNCLPRRGSRSVGSARSEGTGAAKPASRALNWMFWLALGAALVLAVSRLNGDRVTEPDVSSVSSSQQHLADIAPTGIVPAGSDRRRFKALVVASELPAQRHAHEDRLGHDAGIRAIPIATSPARAWTILRPGSHRFAWVVQRTGI